MPSPRILDLNVDTPNPLATMVGEFTKRNRENELQKRDIGALTEVYDKYKRGGQNIEDLLFSVQKHPNLSPTAKVNATSTLLKLHETNTDLQKQAYERANKASESKKKDETEKAKLDREQKKVNDEKARTEEEVYNIYKDVLPEEEARRRSKYDSPQTARTVYAQKTKTEKPAPLNPYERTIQTEEAKKQIKLEEEIPKARDALSNLDYLSQKSKKDLSGLTGIAKSIFNTGDAAEFENLGFTAIEPIIKLFNPVGPIPVQKLRIVQKQFQIHAWEPQSTIDGKINAMRRIGQQALKRAEDRLALIKKYKGQVPQEELDQFDQESLKIEQGLIDESLINLLKDKKDDDLIEGLYDVNGEELDPIPKRDVMNLFKKGLITYVPPTAE